MHELDRVLYQVEMDIANLKLEGFDASDLHAGDNSESIGGPQNCNEPACADATCSNDLDATESKSY